MEIPKEVQKQARWEDEHRLFYERITRKCSCGREYLLIPINNDVVNCVCGHVVDSRLFSLSPRIRQSAQQKMHPTLGESAASDSESKPAPKRVI